MTLREDFERDGVVICRGLVNGRYLREKFDAWYDPNRDRGWNKVDYPAPHRYDHKHYGLSSLPWEDEPKCTASELLDDVVSVYNYRFVIKDKHARDAVFLHQDTPYHVGWPTKLSAFVALSTVCPENGGLEFFLGTHKYGYLGDAGELNPDVLVSPRPYCPVLGPGDVVFMASSTWHRSGPNTCGVDRILADIIYQPASDPSNGFLTKEVRDKLFVRSRASRIKEMQAELDQLKGKK